jgi:CDP-glycerol glycerophosphotransferase
MPDFISVVVTANRHITLLRDRQFPIAGETLETGHPRNDRLARATAADTAADTAAARAELGIAPGERVVVYAPTHREWHATVTPVQDVDELAEALGPDTRILLRGHYFYSGVGLPPRHPRVAVRGVTFDLAGEPPDVFARTVEELVDAFRSGEVADDRSAKARQHFRERFCSLEDGHAAERVVRRVFLGEPLPATADRKVHV